MGALETRQHHRMILIEELEKFEKFAELTDVLDEIRTGKHGNGIDACLNAMARVAKEEKLGSK